MTRDRGCRRSVLNLTRLDHTPGLTSPLSLCLQAIEKFSANTRAVGASLRALCQRLAETEFPNDVGATEELIAEHRSEHGAVGEELEATVKHGEVREEEEGWGRRRGGVRGRRVGWGEG